MRLNSLIEANSASLSKLSQGIYETDPSSHKCLIFNQYDYPSYDEEQGPQTLPADVIAGYKFYVECYTASGPAFRIHLFKNEPSLYYSVRETSSLEDFIDEIHNYEDSDPEDREPLSKDAKQLYKIKELINDDVESLASQGELLSGHYCLALDED